MYDINQEEDDDDDAMSYISSDAISSASSSSDEEDDAEAAKAKRVARIAAQARKRSALVCDTSDSNLARLAHEDKLNNDDNHKNKDYYYILLLLLVCVCAFYCPLTVASLKFASSTLSLSIFLLGAACVAGSQGRGDEDCSTEDDDYA